MSKFMKWAELPAREDIYQERGTTKWGNHDLYPIVPKERTYGISAYFLYWLTCGAGLSTFALGSSYVAVGLTAGQTCGAVLIGCSLTSLTAFLCGRPGAEKNLGYTMLARSAFGLRGMWLPLFFQIMGNMVFFGFQAFYGGQAISLMLGAIIPQYKDMPNTLPTSAGTNTKDLVGFFIYIILYFPVIIWIKPHKLEKFMWPAFVGTIATVFGIMAWTVSTNGGSAGNLVSPAVALSTSARAFRFVQCVSSVGGTYGGAADRFSDWTRFSKTRNASIYGSALALPISITLCALLGVLTASATRAHYGESMWQPLVILNFAQTNHYTSAGRALTFFAGLSIWSHQLFVNVTQNNVAAGMDLAGIFPRYVSTRRGAIFLTLCGIICQPWRFFTQATVFISVISAFGIFTSVVTAIVVLDYWVIRKRAWKVPDLFRGEPDSIYWYTHGINFRAWAVYLITITPAMPGLIMSSMGNITSPAVKIYQINYILGLVLGSILYLSINKLFPPAGLGISEQFEDHTVVTDGISVPSDTNVSFGKKPDTEDKQVFEDSKV